MNYTLKDDYLNHFQKGNQSFVKRKLLPKKKDNKVLIKYFAEVEMIIEKSVSKLPSQKNYIWTKDHINNYMSGKTAFIWVLRVYKLKEPYWAEPTTGAIRYANLKNEVLLDGLVPVLNEGQFIKVLDRIN